MITSRRSFITGLVALVAAPAIVRAGSLMPVKSYTLTVEELLRLRMAEAYRVTRESMARNLYEDLTDATRRGLLPRKFMDVYRAEPLLDAIMNHTTTTVIPWQLTAHRNDAT